MQPRERTKIPGIYQRGDRHQVIYRDRLGRQRSKTVRTLTEAKRFKTSVEADRLRGELRQASTLTVAAYSQEWLGQYAGRTARGVSPSTLSTYEVHIRNHIVPTLGKVRISSLPPTEVKRWATTLAQGVSRSYASIILSTLRLILNTAVEEGLITSNPAAQVRLPSARRGEPEETYKALTEDELARWLDAAGPWRLFFDFMSETGLRIAEACGLQWGDFDGASVKISRQHGPRGFGPPKSKAGYRTIPLSDYMVSQLTALRGAPTAPMFPGVRGEHMRTDGPERIAMREIRERLGLPWASFHTFRHTCATRLFRAKANPKQVQMWLGHHSVAFTMQVYVHLLPEDQINPSLFDELRRQREGNNLPVKPRR